MAVDVSVIVPTFRRPALLREALLSALAQEGVSLEVIVLDDSPERSARETVAAMADPRITYVPREQPSGGRPALVRNDGMRRASGAFVHFLDDDDRAAPGAYRDALRAFGASPAGVVFGRVEPFGEDEADVRREQESFAHAARLARLYQRVGSRRLLVAHEYFNLTTLFVNSACLFRRALLPAVGGYDPRLPVVEDLDFVTRAIRAAGFEFVDRPILQYRITPGSLMSAHRNGSEALNASYQMMYARYRAEHGAAELLAMKVLAKGLLRWL
jgi:glycosyltransferase involved in cell wall biosynthesis